MPRCRHEKTKKPPRTTWENQPEGERVAASGALSPCRPSIAVTGSGGSGVNKAATSVRRREETTMHEREAIRGNQSETESTVSLTGESGPPTFTSDNGNRLLLSPEEAKLLMEQEFSSLQDRRGRIQIEQPGTSSRSRISGTSSGNDNSMENPGLMSPEEAKLLMDQEFTRLQNRDGGLRQTT